MKMKTTLHRSQVILHSCFRLGSGALIALAWLCFGAATVQATTYTLGTSQLWVGPGAGTNSISLGVSPASSNWTASANQSWLHLSVGNQSGTGSTNIVFSYDANPGITRVGSLNISGQTLNISQAGSTYSQPPTHVSALVSNGLNTPWDMAVDDSGNV